MKALSIRQPSAWLIVNGHKDIENRDWATSYRGPILVHASKGMTRDEYQDAADTARAATNGLVKLPPFEELERGGIVGRATITGCVAAHPSPWFFGKFGFVLEARFPLPFQPCRGHLSFFEVPV